MNRILQTGRTGLDSIQKRMDTIAHNIANVQTHGYKSLEVHFGDLVYDQVANRGIPQTPQARQKPVEIGTGSRVKSVMHRFKQGVLQETSNSLDLAIEGEGFFGVESENGVVYLTRNGAFSLDANGNLVDSNGYQLVLDSYVPLSQFSGEDIAIDERGILTSIDQAGQGVVIGRIPLFDVADRAMLTSVGENYFSADQADIFTLDENQAGRIRQGYLESSSVDLAKELTEMLVTQRAYSINTRSIHSADEMWGMVNQLRR